MEYRFLLLHLDLWTLSLSSTLLLAEEEGISRTLPRGDHCWGGKWVVFVLCCCAVLLCWGKYGMVSVWLGSVGSTTIYSTVQLWKCRKSTVFAAFGFTFWNPFWFLVTVVSVGGFTWKACPFLLVKSHSFCNLKKKIVIFLDILKIFPLLFNNTFK